MYKFSNQAIGFIGSSLKQRKVGSSVAPAVEKEKDQCSRR
jgi:hypothetical protein